MTMPAQIIPESAPQNLHHLTLNMISLALVLKQKIFIVRQKCMKQEHSQRNIMILAHQNYQSLFHYQNQPPESCLFAVILIPFGNTWNSSPLLPCIFSPLDHNSQKKNSQEIAHHPIYPKYLCMRNLCKLLSK